MRAWRLLSCALVATGLGGAWGADEAKSLARDLLSSHFDTRWEALRRLREIGPSAGAAVAEVYPRARDSSVKREIADLLLEWSPSVGPAWKFLELLDEEDEGIRSTLAHAASKLGAEAVLRLERMLASGTPPQRDAAAEALARRGGATLETLRALLVGGDAATRLACVRGVARSGSGAEPFFGELAGRMRDEAPEVRLAVVQAIRGLGLRRQESIAACVFGLADGTAAVRDVCIEALASFGPDAAGELLEQARRTPESEAVYAALGRLGVGAVGAISAAMEDAPRSVGCARALAAIGSPAAHPALVARLGDSRPEVRAQAARAIGRCEPAAAEVVDALVAALSDAQPSVRAAAAESIGLLGGAKASTLVPLLDDPSDEAAIAAALAYWRLGGESATAKIRPRVASPTSRILALRALREMGPAAREAAPEILVAAEDPASETRIAAAEALGAMLSLGGGVADRAERRARFRGSARLAAVEAGLRWLAAHQDGETGAFLPDRFMRLDPVNDACTGEGRSCHAPGVTGLALLAWFGAARPFAGPEEEAIRAALRYLREAQDDEGVYGGREGDHHLANHAVATLAMAEATIHFSDSSDRRSLRRAVRYIERARNPRLGWRYRPREGKNDTHMTTWCTWALRWADLAGVEVDPEAFRGAMWWVAKVTDPEWGRTGYDQMGGMCARPEGLHDRFPPEESEAMTAAGAWSWILCGAARTISPLDAKSIKLIARVPPSWSADSGAADLVYWLYGSMVLQQTGEEKWTKALEAALLAGQNPPGSGAKAGSWDPIDPWGAEGGRLYATAMAILCLETLWRTPKGLMGPQPVPPALSSAMQKLDGLTRDPDRAVAARAKLLLERVRRMR